MTSNESADEPDESNTVDETENRFSDRMQVFLIVGGAFLLFGALAIGAAITEPGMTDSEDVEMNAPLDGEYMNQTAETHSDYVLEEGFVLTMLIEETSLYTGERQEAVQVVEYSPEQERLVEYFARDSREFTEYTQTDENVTYFREVFESQSRYGTSPFEGVEASPNAGVVELWLEVLVFELTEDDGDVQVYSVIGEQEESPGTMTHSGELIVEDGVVRSGFVVAEDEEVRSVTMSLSVEDMGDDGIDEPPWLPCTTMFEILGECPTTEDGVPALFDEDGELVQFEPDDWSEEGYVGEGTVTIGQPIEEE